MGFGRADIKRGGVKPELSMATGQPVLDLKPGDVIYLKESETTLEGRTNIINTYTVVNKFPNFYLLIRKGIHKCYSPWEISKRLVV